MKNRIQICTIILPGILVAQLIPAIITGCRFPVANLGRQITELADGDSQAEAPPEVSGGQEEPAGLLEIRIGRPGGIGTGGSRAGAERTLFPDFGTFTGYVLDFTHDDGEAIPQMLVEEGEEVQVALKAGPWTVRATGLIDPPDGEGDDGEDPFAVAWGIVSVEVPAGESVSADIVLDRIVPGGDAEGYFCYAVDFPRELVDSAVMTMSVLGKDGTFSPCLTIDLREKHEAAIPLPPGYYRMDYEILGPYARHGGTEAVHIFPRLKTGGSSYSFTEADFPPYWEFSSTEALKNHLAGLDGNTPQNPYPVKMTGIDLSVAEKTGENLRTLCAALSRFVSLDLSECRGDSIPSMTLTIAPNKKNIISVVLPATVTSIDPNAFSGYSALVSIDLPGVTRLGKGAFKQDAMLESVYLPELITIDPGDAADAGAFRDCISLSTVYMPKVKSVGDYAFYGCDSLAVVSLPGATSVGKSAFRYCDALTSAELPAAESLGNYSFYNCPLFSVCTLGAVPPALGGKYVFDSGKPLEGIFVPAEGIDAYAAAAEFWSAALKDKVKTLEPTTPAE